MKTLKFTQFLIALLLLVSVSSCTTYYRGQPTYGRHYGARRPTSPPPASRPYGGNYGYGRPGW